MIRNQQLPEQAIRQSNEFIDLGKKETALDVLYDALRVKRGKSWSVALENVMNNFLSLCLSLRNFMSVKEGLYQYRLLCQNTNILSFENVILKFINISSDASDKAKEESREKVFIEDLDELETPETILLKSVSETSQQDRSDRFYLSPTIRFMWEILRSILELCRNNKNMEKLYMEVMKKTLKFLYDYGRKSEFKKLCDITRIHLQQMFKYNESHYCINLTEVVSFDIQMEIRLSQLDTAILLELWIEAFKTMEDIHMLLRNYRKTPHPKILAIFYQKISLVFSKVNVPLFHAVSLQKLFVLIQEYKKGFKPEELERISTKAMAATISIPLYYDLDSIDTILFRYYDKITYLLQLSSILGLNIVPNRSSLIDDIIKRSILQYSNKSMVNIFNALQNYQYYPLCLCKYVEEQLSLIPQYLLDDDDIKCYFPQIKYITFCIFLKRMSLFYQSIKLNQLVLYSIYYNKQQVLDILLDSSRSNFIKFTINDETDYVYFNKSSSSHVSATKSSYQLYSTNEKNLFLHLYSSPLSYTIANVSSNSSYLSLFNQESNQNNYNEQKYLNKLISDYSNKHINFSQISAHLYYEEIQKNINIYREKLSIESDRLQQIQKNKMDEEHRKIAKLQEEALDQEREIRQKEQIVTIKMEAKKQITRQQVEELVNKDGAKKLLKDISLEDLERDPERYLNVHKELRDKEISMHVKKMKRIDELLDVFVFIIRKKERKILSVWISNSAKERYERWLKRKSEMIEIINRSNKTNSERQSRLISLKDDLTQFMEISKKEAERLHKISADEHKLFIETERTRLLQERRIQRIKARKEKHLEELKNKYFNPIQHEIKRELPQNSEKNTSTKTTKKYTPKASSGVNYFA